MTESLFVDAIPATLKERIKARHVIPFVGAGVSRGIINKQTNGPLFPSWKELLTRAADRLKAENKTHYSNLVNSLLEIEQPDYLEAAKYAKKGLGAVWFELLKSQFDHTRESALDSSLDLAKAVWELGSNLIITTNYDRSLRWASKSQGDLSEWSIQAPAEQAVMMREGLQRPVVWHLHGNIDDSANLILTPDGYERLYPSAQVESHYSAGLQTLGHLLQSRSFLFIGFSLSDEAFGLQLKAVSENFSGATGPHYALVHKDSVESVRKQNLGDIEIIPFENYGGSLVSMVSELSKHSLNSESTVVAEIREDVTTATTSIAVEVLSTDREIIPINSAFQSECDTPHPIGTWVGRSDELDLLALKSHKVIAVTGIGGQGKSTLVAKHLKELGADYTIWDWRDCKEEANTLHTHLVRIIERITTGKRRSHDLAGEKIEDVIKLFHNLTASIQGVFVFDNIDKYVDVSRSQTVGGMHEFILGALKNVGNSKFIFTARPRIDYEVHNFLQIELHGLSIEETSDFFKARGVDEELKSIEEVHDITQGHPLWIGLIANQVTKNKVEIRDLVARIRTGRETGLPNAMLREIWKTLNPKQQKLLRYIAEIVRPETENQISLYVGRDLNHNQFAKSLRQLKALDLVVVKSPQNSLDTLELHPLIREFVRRQYSKNERTPYISAIIVFVDKAIVALRATLTSNVPYSTLQNWSAKVDLLTNSGEYAEGLLVLDEARLALFSNGYAEEFIRLATGLLVNHDWNDPSTSETKAFVDVCKDLVDSLAHMGRFHDCDEYISRFEGTVSGATARYVCLCQMRTHYYWLKGQFDLAKEWGKRGVELKKDSDIDTLHDCSHDLALAQRDSGDVDTALDFFLQDEDLEKTCNPLEIDRGRAVSFYGNIGRCLFLKAEYDKALICLIKSAWLVERTRDSTTPVNVGWASRWLGETLEKQSLWDQSYICYRRAAIKWRSVSPLKGGEAMTLADSLRDRIAPAISLMDDNKIMHRFDAWLSHQVKFS